MGHGTCDGMQRMNKTFFLGAWDTCTSFSCALEGCFLRLKKKLDDDLKAARDITRNRSVCARSS